MRRSRSHGLETALLTGDGLWEWKQAIEGLAQGTEAPRERLLEQGSPAAIGRVGPQSFRGRTPLQRQPAVVVAR